MSFALVFDCEFLTAEGSPSRFWCGPRDPDPVVAQIGIAKLGLAGDFPLLDTIRLYVAPRNRHGAPWHLDPFFTRLTGITPDHIAAEGIPLEQALRRVEDFAEGRKLWSWGKDEFNMVAISCYVEGLTPPLPARQFGNACDLLLKAGMPYDDLKRTRSDKLADHFKIEHPPLRGHDALDDALSVTYVLQHFLRQGALTQADFA
ncbi:exonuclease domain-containing protein [Mameliella sediminis]|uniref:exonuclease domain-containing protein n=1 Tax=Mameliella sediminis TaxID=2836866 RepID=UPI001C493D0B|nr:exonuclease domain-containing protein [Mameliella sediminis]MBV7394830.1 exonuclease [Mameliella sediminis]MBY6159975.1 exonuclease [Mameliella alba]MBY6168446.1 exonuclease [Mameliella alba]MBY6173466.1 exonuclease [Mameliella alba]